MPPRRRRHAAAPPAATPLLSLLRQRDVFSAHLPPYRLMRCHAAARYDAAAAMSGAPRTTRYEAQERRYAASLMPRQKSAAHVKRYASAPLTRCHTQEE